MYFFFKTHFWIVHGSMIHEVLSDKNNTEYNIVT